MTDDFKLYAGVVWATEEHEACALDANGKKVGAALVHIPNSQQIAPANASIHILTAHETGIPSSVMRLRMSHASRASTA